jgi:hypothetical protein
VASPDLDVDVVVSKHGIKVKKAPRPPLKTKPPVKDKE